MKFRRFISSAAILLIILINVISDSGCANIVPPEGGARDTIPPVLMKVSPGDSARNFKGKTIVFTFDEYVDVQNVQENLLVSPLPRLNPSVDVKLKTVTLKIKDSLEANTTYSFDFGKAVKDFTEGNSIKGLTYTFSTGRYIDSLEFNGRVILAETGKIDTTIMVMLHTNPNDSAILKEKPRYVARLDSKGNFHFRNLPAKTFYVYALKDENGTYRYSDKQLFGFADKPVSVDSKTEPVIIYAYGESQTSTSQGTAPGLSLPGVGRRKTGNETADKRLKYQTNITDGQMDLLTSFYMTFEQPLRSFDSSKIKLYTDSVYNPVAAYRFQKDSSNKKISLVTQWKENTLYHIIMDKEFAADSSGKKLLKTDTLSFTTKKLSGYGSLKIKFRNLPMDRNPVLLFMQGEVIYKSYVLTGSDFSQPLFLPGEFELRLLADTNKNGKWDPGEFFGKHKQPEIVKPIEKKITVKAAWQNEFEIAL